jgi:CDP-glucose 4,6-dehydratase
MESMEIKQRLSNYYKGKKVFITGHTGFKGSWLLAILNELGANVKGYSLSAKSSIDLFPILSHTLSHESVIADVRNLEQLTNEIVSFNPDFIFHLAAQPLVRKSYKLPSETFDVNVVGTSNLLEAVRKLENECHVVIITTDKVYQNKEQSVYYLEEDLLGGYDPYSASKACAELVVSSFRNSFFNVDCYPEHKKSIATARAGNVIGGGDRSEDRLVPDIVKALSSNIAIPIRNPNSIRPWQHVLEPLSGYLLLGTFMKDNPQKFSTAFNFGPIHNDHLKVRELLDISIKSWGSGIWEDHSNEQDPHEAGILMLDINKAISELGWTPKLNATQAIEWTLDWYKKSDAEKAEFTYFQIHQFLSL